MPEIDPSVFDVDPLAPDAKARMQALIQLLGQQQQGNVMGAMGGTLRTGMQHLGQGMEQQAQQQMGMVQGAPAARLKLALDKFKLGQEGPQEALGGQTPEIFKLLTARMGSGKYAVNQATGGLYDVHTGKAGPGQANAAPGGLDPKALEQMAEMFHTTGTLPSMGMGAAGVAVRRAIVNRAAELHPDANLAGNKAGYHADTASLGKLRTQSDSINAFERTALANLDQFLQTAKGVVDTGSPLFNMPARKFMQSVAGDPKMTEFNTARQVAVQEISKVLGGALGGVVSDSARHEASGLLSPDASLAQIEAAAKILRQDMHNRRTSMETEIQGITARAGGQPQTAAPAPTTPAAAPAPVGARPRRTVKGETREWDGKAWVPVNG